MSDVLSNQIPDDCYATAFDAASAKMARTDRIGPGVDRLNKKIKRLEGLMVAARFSEVLDSLDGIGMELLRVYRGSSNPRDPNPSLFEIFTEARKA